MLGVCMILMSLLIWISNKRVLIFSMLVIFAHNLLDLFDISGNLLWALLHQQEFFKLSETSTLVVGYPLVPWIGVMSLGYFFGDFYNRDYNPKNRIKILKTLGLFFVVGGYVLIGL